MSINKVLLKESARNFTDNLFASNFSVNIKFANNFLVEFKFASNFPSEFKFVFNFHEFKIHSYSSCEFKICKYTFLAKLKILGKSLTFSIFFINNMCSEHKLVFVYSQNNN